jgi:tetratricopeptide (TPR) repeat protein
MPVSGAADIYQRRVEDYESSRSNGNSHARRILYVDALLHLNEPRQAIQALIEAEVAFPESYLNAMYLGLAYEMAGDLKSARHWVSKTIERNTEARNSSEWLHLAMIEARLALAKDPEWLKSHTVLESNTHRTAEEILSAIRIQIAVRGDFGLKPDAVVSDLYFEAGICATSLSARQEYFANSLEISPLRLLEIQQQEKVRAKAQASAQLN